jgi:hypothetical protein
MNSCSLINLAGMPLVPREVLYSQDWEFLLDLTLPKSKLDITHAYSYVQLNALQKKNIAIAVINQRAIRGLKRSLLASLDGRMANKRLDACDGGDLQSVWIVYRLASLLNQL